MSSLLRSIAADLRSQCKASRRDWYDHIVVGAGTAGSVVASRLAGKGSKVLLLESSPLAECGAPVGRCGALLRRARAAAGGSRPSALWARGHSSDYCAWADAAGAASWLPENLEQHWQRGESLLADGGEEEELVPDVCKAFVQACADLGLAEHVGLGVGRCGAGVGYFRRVVSGSGARRWAQDEYLSSAMLASGPDGQQLEVMSANARRVRLDSGSGRVLGVEWDGGFAGAGEVVLCAGAVGSPELLLRSGIGPRAELEGLGIDVVHELPGVGANYQDRWVLRMPCTGFEQRGAAWWKMGEEGPCPSKHYVGGGYIASEASLAMPDLVALADPTSGAPLALAPARPSGRGRVLLQPAAEAALCQARISFDGLANADDRRVLLQGARRLVDVLAVTSPSLVELTGRGLDLNDDASSLAFLRRHCGPAGHAVGTCAMGSDEMAVVDGELRVHGVQGLRVADASVMPSLVGADPHGSVVAVAETASSLLGKAMFQYHRSTYGIPPALSA